MEIKQNHYDIYLDREISLENVVFLYKRTPFPLDADINDFIEKNWEKNKAKSPDIYNGKLYNLVDVVKDDGCFTFFYDVMDYKTLIATKEIEFKKRCPDYKPVYLVVTGILKTSDNKILIGSDLRLKNNLQSWKFPGGFFDVEQDKTILDCLQRECQEEIGSFAFLDPKIINISKNLDHNFVAVICLVPIKETSDEVLAFNSKNKDKIIDSNEMQVIKFLDFESSSIADILNSNLISLSPTTLIGLKQIQVNLEKALVK